MHECTVYNHRGGQAALEVILRALRVARHLLSPWMFIHLLLVVAIVVVLIRVIQGRRPI
jgi:hypothetical protein